MKNETLELTLVVDYETDGADRDEQLGKRRVVSQLADNLRDMVNGAKVSGKLVEKTNATVTNWVYDIKMVKRVV